MKIIVQSGISDKNDPLYVSVFFHFARWFAIVIYVLKFGRHIDGKISHTVMLSEQPTQPNRPYKVTASRGKT